jgi:hypothetical protein
MNPFEVDKLQAAKPLPTRGQGKRLAEALRTMDINDTRTDGLAVYLQSPSIKRRYWDTRYASEYRQLAQMAQWAEAIEAYLHDHKCEELAKVFAQEMSHFAQLTKMKAELHMNEEASTLSGMEQSLFQQARQMGEQMGRIWDILRDRWNTADVNQKAETLKAPARRALQRWLHQFTSEHKDDKHRMSPALVQDIYRIQNYL